MRIRRRAREVLKVYRLDFGLLRVELIIRRFVAKSSEICVYLFVFFAMASPCYYAANQAFSTCVQRAHVTIWMRGRRGPKERSVCSICSAWLTSQGLADKVEAGDRLEVPYNDVPNALSPAPVPMLPEAVTIGTCPGQWEPCYYADNVSMPACKQRSSHMVWMCSKRATPKERACCTVCFAWLVGENLAEPLGDPSQLTLRCYDQRATRCSL